MKKIVSMALALVLALATFTSCKEKYTTVMTINGMEVPAGVYLVCQIEAYNAAAAEIGDTSEMTEKEFLKMEIDGVPVADWIHEDTIKKCRKYVYAEQNFATLGLEFTEEELASNTSNIDEVWEVNQTFFEKNGVGFTSFEMYMTSAYKYNKLHTEFTSNEEWDVTDEEAIAYLTENYAKVEMVYFYKISLATYAALDDETVAMIHAGADALAAALNDGSVTKTESVEKYIMPSYLLMGYTEEDLETSPESYYYSNFVPKENTSFSEELTAEIFAGDVDGVYRVAEADNFFIVWTRLANYETEAEFEELRPSIRYEMIDEAFTDTAEAEYEAYEADIDEAAVKHYSINNIVWE